LAVDLGLLKTLLESDAGFFPVVMSCFLLGDVTHEIYTASSWSEGALLSPLRSQPHVGIYEVVNRFALLGHGRYT